MKKSLVALFFITFFIASPLYALRCGNDIVSEGDLKATVRKLCGEPVDITPFFKRANVSNRLTIYQTGEQWTYNFGNNDFLYVLTFRGNRLISIETDGKGY